jgi:hypothetical protein
MKIGATVQEAIGEALQDAAAATSLMVFDNPNVWFPCGFASVRIKPARGKLVQALKDMNLGMVSQNGGYLVMNPSGNHTQWMHAKEAGARAFKYTLVLWLLANPKDAGTTKITVETQLD